MLNAIVTCPLAVVIMVGALSMKKLMARWLALTAGVLAVLPLSVTWFVTLPLGIWSLVVLNKRTIEDAFDARTIDRESVQQQIRRLAVLDLYIGILAAALLVPLPIALLLIVAARKMRRLESYSWAVTASLLVMLSVIGLPIGLWSLAVLTGRDVKRLFQRQNESTRADAAKSSIPEAAAAQQHDDQSERTEPAASESEAAREVVKAPAIGLLVAGAINFASPILTVVGIIIFGLLQPESHSIGGPWLPWRVVGLGMLNAMFICPLSVVTIVGALSMKKLMARWLALTAGILAVLPLSVTWPVSLPLGIWSLVVLNKRTIEDAFDARTIDRESVQQQIRRLALLDLYIGILAAALLVPLPIALLLIVAARKMRRLESYAWAVTASLLVMLSVIGLPIGLWSLAVLTAPGAKSVFASQR